jgi:hypothetical protein
MCVFSSFKFDVIILSRDQKVLAPLRLSHRCKPRELVNTQCFATFLGQPPRLPDNRFYKQAKRLNDRS